MLFTETMLRGAYVIDIEKRQDERGFFARSWSMDQFEERGLSPRLVQCSISFNKTRGTLRGMHYQIPPYEEVKLVRCTMGALLDVIIDLREGSPTFKKWLGVELSAESRRAVYVPEGLAHGFQTLLDHTEVFYQVTEFYHPECARGVRWDDPAFGIAWPLDVTTISREDSAFLDFK